MYDVAVIGGGLAGLTLAIQMAKAKKSVVVFETHRYPFHKVCGEYVAMESWSFLERIGVPLSDMALPRITELIVSSPTGKTLSHPLNPGGFGISRYTLDAALAKIAKDTGVLLLEGTKVTSVHFDQSGHTIFTSTSAEYRAKIVVGAYGKRSTIDKHLNRAFVSVKNTYVSVKYHVKANLPDHRIELHNFRDGYCGICKVDNERYCLCYLTTSDHLKKSSGNINEMEKIVLMKNPFLKRYFSEFPSLYDKPCVISQISFSGKSLIKDHILMVGDASGLIAPLCGNGMSMAMNASAILAPLLIAYLEDQITRSALESNYQLQWRQNFSTRLTIGRILQRVFGNPALTNLAISTLKHMPYTFKTLVRSTHGKAF